MPCLSRVFSGETVLGSLLGIGGAGRLGDYAGVEGDGGGVVVEELLFGLEIYAGGEEDVGEFLCVCGLLDGRGGGWRGHGH